MGCGVIAAIFLAFIQDGVEQSALSPGSFNPREIALVPIVYGTE
jgi:hypothetical protein